MKELIKLLSQYGEVEENVSLKKLTTFKVGGTAMAVVYPRNNLAVKEVVEALQQAGIPFKVFGNGSNLLASEDYYEGVIIKLSRVMNDIYYDGCEVNVQAGASIINLAYDCGKRGLSGLEFASGIPGTVGGCIYMNAGAYKGAMSDVVASVQVLTEDGVIWLDREQCEFGYRTSIFQKHPDWVIVAARMLLTEGDREQITDLMKNRQVRRFDTQPLEYPSAGSVFRNPEGDFAWKLIDSIGYRGVAYGDALVSHKHSNFIVNAGKASADDINRLITDIQQKVKEEFGKDMILEVEKFNWKN